MNAGKAGRIPASGAPRSQDASPRARSRSGSPFVSTNSNVSRAWATLLLTLRRWGRRPVRVVFLIGLAGMLGSAGVALVRGVPVPVVHDEFSYLLGADTFAEGRLTNETHPMWWHFESFHIIHEPSYQSKYPPGQALLLALGQRVTGTPAAGLWIGAGLLAAAMSWALLTWLPAHWGVLTAVLATAQLSWFSYWSQSYWGGAVAATGGALCIGALPVLWRRPSVKAGIPLGIGLAVLSISRPFEGALLGVFLGGALAYRLARTAGSARSSILLKGMLTAALVVAAGLAWQAYYNVQVTGSALTMPYQEDDRQYGAAPTLLFQVPESPPEYRHAVIEQFWLDWGRDRHLRQRELGTFSINVPLKTVGLLLFFLGPGVLALVGLRSAPAGFRVLSAAGGTALIFAVALLTKGTYAHYVAPVSVLLYVLMGAGLAGLHRASRRSDRINLAIPIVAAFLTTVVVSLSSFLLSEHRDFARQRASLESGLARTPGDHLLIVRYGPEHNPHIEWVYNRADIDGASVVWAREMSPELNARLIRYFEGRTIWRLSVEGVDFDLAPYPMTEKPGTDGSSAGRGARPDGADG